MANVDYSFEAVEEKGPGWVGLAIGLGIVAFAAIGFALYFRLVKPRIVPAPLSYSTFTAPDSSFKIDGPVGWSSTRSGSGALTSGVTFTSGNAKIDVTADLVGSLTADLAQAQNNQVENTASIAETNAPPPVPPIEKVHQSGLQEIEGNYDKYSEMPMQQVTSKMGDGRFSEFNADGGSFVGKLHGYRATFLSRDDRITVITVCPENNWAILKLAFQHVIMSVDRGSSG